MQDAAHTMIILDIARTGGSTSVTRLYDLILYSAISCTNGKISFIVDQYQLGKS